MKQIQVQRGKSLSVHIQPVTQSQAKPPRCRSEVTDRAEVQTQLELSKMFRMARQVGKVYAQSDLWSLS